jgi:hypothetical protein
VKIFLALFRELSEQLNVAVDHVAVDPVSASHRFRDDLVGLR